MVQPSKINPCKFEVVARKAGWTRRDLKSHGLVPHYFYHAASDILDTESMDWKALCESQPRLMAMLEVTNDSLHIALAA